MHYYLIIGLQAFCIYHLIKNRNPYYWIFVIIFLPVIGSLIYIFSQIYKKRDVAKINQEVTSVINPTKKVKDLEKKLKFVETYQNRVNLADAYFNAKEYKKAITNYKIALQDDLQNNEFVIENLIEALFYSGAYEEVLVYVDELKELDSFQGSESQFIYGLTLEKLNKIAEAEINLRPIDQRYSNYNQRLVLAKFLKRQGKDSDSQEILNDVFIESKNMNNNNRRKYRATIKEVEELLNTN